MACASWCVCTIELGAVNWRASFCFPPAAPLSVTHTILWAAATCSLLLEVRGKDRSKGQDQRKNNSCIRCYGRHWLIKNK